MKTAEELTEEFIRNYWNGSSGDSALISIRDYFPSFIERVRTDERERITKTGSTCNSLAKRVLAMCKKRNWCLNWSSRGTYLHLESSELIEAVRGKGDSTVTDEAGDVLLVLMSITENEGIAFSDVIGAAIQKCAKLEALPRYEGEEFSPESSPETHLDLSGLSPEDREAIRVVVAERVRQVEVEGWTAENDDAYSEGELPRAAGCYALAAADYVNASGIRGCRQTSKGTQVSEVWAWLSSWWKPSPHPGRNLEKAGALILAEMARLLRIKPEPTDPTTNSPEVSNDSVIPISEPEQWRPWEPEKFAGMWLAKANTAGFTPVEEVFPGTSKATVKWRDTLYSPEWLAENTIELKSGKPPRYEGGEA